MRFTAYHPWIHLKSGLERLFIELLQRSRHDWTMYTSYFDSAQTFAQFGQLQVEEVAPRALPIGGPVRTLATALAVARSRIPDPGDASLIGLNGISDLALLHSPHPSVGLCFTPVKAMHDEHAIAALRENKPAKYWVARALAPPFGAADRALWRRLDSVIAISEETRRRVERAGLATPDRIEVIHPGVDTDRYTPSKALQPNRLLAAGRISWHKNLELAIDTVAELQTDRRDVRLVIAGHVAPTDEDYVSDLQGRSAGLPVDFVRDPSDEVLRALYSESEAVLFTARNEDFGLVPLEAMASGTPVISVDAGGPRETIAHGSGGWLVQGTPEAFAAQVRALLSSPDRQVHRQAARRRAEEFGWDSFASRVDSVMEQAVSESSHRASR